jgi:hypothetical protein
MTMVLGPSKAVIAGEFDHAEPGAEGAEGENGAAPEAEAPAERAKPVTRQKPDEIVLGSPEQLAD